MVFDKGEKFEKIIMYLSIVRYIVESSSKSNLTSTNIHAEDFYCSILNLVYDWRLENLNKNDSRYPGIDLGGGKVAVQVTATNKSCKIKDTLETFDKEKYHERYNRLYIFLLSHKLNYRENGYDELVKIEFDVKENVIDLNDLLVKIDEKGRKDESFLDELCTYLENNLPKVQKSLTESDSLLNKYERNVGGKAITLDLYFNVNDINDLELEDRREDIEDHNDLYTLLNRNLNKEDREILYMLIDISNLENNEILTFNKDIVLSKVFENDVELMQKYSSMFDELGFLAESFSPNSYELQYIGKNSGYNLLAGMKSYANDLSNEYGSYRSERILKRIVIDLEFNIYDQLD